MLRAHRPQRDPLTRRGRVKVLYVLGRGRSGSTIFANVLGAHPGFFSAGEVRVLWDPVMLHDGRCGCGLSVRDCPVWSRVSARLGGIDVADAARLQREVVTERRLPRMLIGGRLTASWSALARFSSIMQRVYEAVAEVTGAEIIVDSSKRPSYAALVLGLDNVDPYFVQLTRDPRASAHSWKHRRHESVHEGREVTRREALDSTLRWDLLNAGAEAVMHRAGPHRAMRIRYEDFVSAPRAVVDQTLELVGARASQSPFTGDRTVELAPTHTLAGNPSRFAAGSIELHDSEDWRRELAAGDALTASVVALPFLRRYGYPFRP